jgi:hypothetical protein
MNLSEAVQEQPRIEDQLLVDQKYLYKESPPRRTSRISAGIKPRKLIDYECYMIQHQPEPRSIKQVYKSSEKDQWIQAMSKEIQSLRNNKTWRLVDKPSGKNIVGSRWVFKRKLDSRGNVIEYKARLVAQGYSQKYGADYFEVFAPVVRSSTFRMLLAVAGDKGMIVRQFDVKSAFLNGILDEEIYMQQPPGFEEDRTKVCRLIKSIYGLKQAARVWNEAVSAVLLKLNFRKSEHDKCLYIMKKKEFEMYLIIHVDDMLIACTSLEPIQEVENKINKHLEVKDLGNVKTFLSIEVIRDSGGNFHVHQSSYIDKIIAAGGQENSKISKTPMDEGYYKIKCEEYLPNNEFYRQLIGMLLYVCTNTRPDIAASVCILSQKVEKPTTLDMNQVIRIIRYLKGTKDYKIKWR